LSARRYTAASRKTVAAGPRNRYDDGGTVVPIYAKKRSNENYKNVKKRKKVTKNKKNVCKRNKKTLPLLSVVQLHA